MKYTIVVTPESMQHRALDAILTEVGFYEESRQASGGYMSEPILIINYSGAVSNVGWDKAFNSYVQIADGLEYSYFFSLNCQDGYRGKTLEQFKDIHFKKFKDTIEVKEF